MRLVTLLKRRARAVFLDLKHPGVDCEGAVQIERGCHFKIARSGRLTLRDVYVGAGSHIEVGAGAVVHLNADYVGPNCVIVARESVTIGTGTKLAEMVVVRDADHDHTYRLSEHRYLASPIEIGEDVWLGAKATVLRGVEIGDSVTVGAGAVVTKSLPARVVAAGVPARVLRAK